MIARNLLAFVAIACASQIAPATPLAGASSYIIRNQFPNPHGPGYATAIACFGNQVWCGEYYSQKIYRVDASSGVVLGYLDAPISGIHGLVHDGSSLWLTGPDYQVYEVDPISGALRSAFLCVSLPSYPLGIALDGLDLVISDGQGRVHWYSKTGSVLPRTVTLGPPPTVPDPWGIAVDSGILYASDQVNQEIVEHDLATGAVLVVHPAPGGPKHGNQGLAVGWKGSLWTTGATNATCFELRLRGWKDLGHALAGSTLPSLEGTGLLVSGAQVDLKLSNAHPNSVGGLVLGVTRLDAPFYGGTLVPTPTALIGIPTGPAGEITLSGIAPPITPPGTSLYAQYWISDPGGPFGYSASNAVTQVVP